jgi:hypothetical protein
LRSRNSSPFYLFLSSLYKIISPTRLSFSLFFFIVVLGFWTQGVTLARHFFYHLSQVPSPIFLFDLKGMCWLIYILCLSSHNVLVLLHSTYTRIWLCVPLVVQTFRICPMRWVISFQEKKNVEKKPVSIKIPCSGLYWTRLKKLIGWRPKFANIPFSFSPDSFWFLGRQFLTLC